MTTEASTTKMWINDVEVYRTLVLNGNRLQQVVDRHSENTEEIKRVHSSTARADIKTAMGEHMGLKYEQGVVTWVKNGVCEIIFRDSAGTHWRYKSKKVTSKGLPDTPAAIDLINRIEKSLQERPVNNG